MDAGRAADLYDAVVVGAARRAGRPLPLPAPGTGCLSWKGHLRWADNDHRRSGELSRRGKDRRPFAHRNHARRQALHFGAEFLLAEAQGIDVDGDFRIVRTSRGLSGASPYCSPPGPHPRKVGFEGEETFRGRGVAYCATCDGGVLHGQGCLCGGRRIRRRGKPCSSPGTPVP